MKRRKPNEGKPVHVTPELLKKYPKLAKKLGIEDGPKLKVQSPKAAKAVRPSERRYEVSWYAPAVDARRTYNRAVVAANKEGAIREVRSWLRNMAFWEHKGATNFMARQTNNSQKSAVRGQKATSGRTKNLFGLGKKTRRRKAAARSLKGYRIIGLNKNTRDWETLGYTSAASNKNAVRDHRREMSAAERSKFARYRAIQEFRAANQTETQVVSPKLAMRWLNTNKNRSDIISPRVVNMAAKMKAGTFEAKSPLLFKNGKLVDGRHRLSAVVLSGKNIRFPVERVKSARAKNPPLWSDIIGGLAGGAGYAAAAAIVGEKLKKRKNTGEKKRKPNKARRTNTASTARLFREFHGHDPSGKVLKLFTPSSTPKDITMDGPIIDLRLKNGGVIRLAKTDRDALRSPQAFMGHAQRGATKRIYIGLVTPFGRQENGQPIEKSVDHGPAASISYWCAKPHLTGHNRPVPWEHQFGDRGGRLPNVILRPSGCIDLRYGDYTVMSGGIDN